MYPKRDLNPHSRNGQRIFIQTLSLLGLCLNRIPSRELRLWVYSLYTFRKLKSPLSSAFFAFIRLQHSPN